MAIRIVLVLTMIILLSPTAPRSGPGGSQTSIVPGVSPSQDVEVLGGSSEEIDRIHLALDRFAAAGLDLPDLQIVFADGDACAGRLAFFQERAAPWRITICSRLDFVYEHELAHAWERANLTDDTREAFMAAYGYATWSGEGVAWADRGVEGVAIVIQQGVAGLPLNAQLGESRVRRLAAYELLTGHPAPIVTDFVESRAVPCEQRPTDLSRGVVDAEGNSCEPPNDGRTSPASCCVSSGSGIDRALSRVEPRTLPAWGWTRPGTRQVRSSPG